MRDVIEIHVVLDGPVPVYRQIADAVRAHCVSGRLEPGMKLPAVRELAGLLGVHFNTVAEAYRTLAEEGWLLIEGRRGAVVKYRDQPAPPSRETQTREGNRVRHLIAELLAKGFSRESILKEVEAALGSL
jgi:GntR family transcriptional regulator